MTTRTYNPATHVAVSKLLADEAYEIFFASDKYASGEAIDVFEWFKSRLQVAAAPQPQEQSEPVADIDLIDCHTCKGRGHVLRSIRRGECDFEEWEDDCPDCDGSGVTAPPDLAAKVAEQSCSNCGTAGCTHNDARRCGPFNALWTDKENQLSLKDKKIDHITKQCMLTDSENEQLLLKVSELESTIAAQAEQIRVAKSLVKDAYMEGFFDKETYNDVQLNDESETWEKSYVKQALAKIGGA